MLKPKNLPVSTGAENLAGMMVEYTRGMDVHDIVLEELRDAPEDWNFFRPLPDGKMLELVESIRENGLLVPLIVWEQAGDGYRILSGHNRRRALEMLREDTQDDRFARAACVVYRADSLTPEEARSILIDCNWVQRTLSPSEKARAVYAKYVELGRLERGSGKRRYDVVAEHFGLKATQVYQYYKLAKLEPYWLKRLDEGTLTIRAAAHLAAFTPGQRTILRSKPSLTAREILDMEPAYTHEELLYAVARTNKPMRELRVMVPEDRYENIVAMVERYLAKGEG